MAVNNELDMANELNIFYHRFGTRFKMEQHLVSMEVRGMVGAGVFPIDQ